MKKQVTTILLIIFCDILYSQPKVTLNAIAEKLDSYQSYQSNCDYTFSFPFGDPMTLESTIVIKKVPSDTLSGFYYHFEYNKNSRQEYGSSIYFKNAVYNSYNGNVKKTSLSEKPEAFKDLKIGSGHRPAIQHSPQLYYITPYQLAKEIGKTLEDDNSRIYQLQDTIINQDTCLRFILESRNEVVSPNSIDTINIRAIFELCFHKTNWYPVFYKKDTKSDFINSFQIANFRNTKVNTALPSNYFSEENLLPKNWASINKPVETKNSASLIGQKAPDWNLPVLGKNEYLSNRDLTGKYILLDFTATWCAHCMEAAEMMNRLEEKFKNSEKIAIVSVFSSDRDKKDGIEKFAEKLKMKSTILYSASDIGEQYQVFSYPNFIIVSPTGKVFMNFPGYNETVEKNITNVLSEFSE